MKEEWHCVKILPFNPDTPSKQEGMMTERQMKGQSFASPFCFKGTPLAPMEKQKRN